MIRRPRNLSGSMVSGAALIAGSMLGNAASLLGTATSQLGGVAPYHYWDFINDRALFASADVGAVTATPGWSFTRASTGYAETVAGTLTSFASGALRRTDKGVLIEGARTNLCLRSQEFDNASWTKLATTVTANQIAAPDGTTTADLFSADGSASQHYIALPATLSATTFTASIYVKANTATHVRFQVTGDNIYAEWSLSTWTVTNSGVTTGTLVSTSTEALGNGWYRLIMVFTTTGANTVRFHVNNAASASANPTQTHSLSCYLWNAQVEQASFASSPIVTTTASATRAADVLTVPVNTSAQIAAAVVGQTEILANPGFSTGDLTSWTTVLANATVTSNQLVLSGGGGFAAIGQSLTITNGNWYAASVEVISATGGAVTLDYRNNATPGNGSRVTSAGRSSAGTITILFRAQAGNNIEVRLDGATSATFDNVSIKEIPAGALTLYPCALFAEFERVVDTGAVEYLVQVDAGDTNNRAYMIVQSNDFTSINTVAAGAGQGTVATLAPVLGATTKSAAVSAANRMQIATGATLGTEDTSVTTPSAPTHIRIGSNASGTEQSFGYIQVAAIVRSAATDAQLQAMTT